MAKEYLADGVYVELDRERACVTLTTENGYEATNTIYLDLDVLRAFDAWRARREVPIFAKGGG